MPLAIGGIVALSAPAWGAPTHPPPTGSAIAWELAFIALALTVLVALWWADVVRPGSFARRARSSGLRDVSFMPWFGWLAAAVAMLCALVLGGSLGNAAAQVLGYADAPADGMSAGAQDRSPAEQTLATAGSFLCAAGAGVTLILVLSRAPGGPGATAAGLRVRPADAILGLAWFLLAFPIVLATNMLAAPVVEQFSGRPPEELAHETLRTIVAQRSDLWIWGLVLGAAVGAPVVEEITYRVFVQSGFLRVFRSAWAAIFVTSAVFAAMHLSIADTRVVPGLFVLSVCMGVAYERTRRLGVPIAMHMLFNTVNLAMVLGR